MFDTLSSSQGQSLNLIQDLPISRPYAPSDIDALTRSKDVATLCGFYIDLASAGARIQAVLERMRALGGVVTFTLVKVINLFPLSRKYCKIMVQGLAI